MHRKEAVCAIPLWLNGRASLKLTQVFHDLRNPVTGEVLRRIPLCGPEDFQEALQSAQGGRDAWLELGGAGRFGLLAALGDALSALSNHFASMIAEETGASYAQADQEIARAVSFLREPNVLPVGGVGGVAVVSGASKSFSSIVGQAAAALAGGATLIVCPTPESPTALFALAELSGRCGFPPGVINLLYPRAEVLGGLGSSADFALLP